MKRQPRLFEPEVPIPEEVREAVELWTAYKREQFRFTYKPLALAALVERMAAMGPERAIAAVKWSMNNGYEGLYEEKKQNGHGRNGGPPQHLTPWMSDEIIERWPYFDQHTQRTIIENITMGHPTRYR